LFDGFLNELQREGDLQRKGLHGPERRTMTTPYNPYHIISDEANLLNAIRDIRDELRMLRTLAEGQEVGWKEAFATEKLKNCFQYYHPCTPTDVKKDLDEMLIEAERTEDSVSVFRMKEVVCPG
jgi:hypothetical protein